MAGGNSSFAYKSIIMALITITALPLLINIFAVAEEPLSYDEALSGYYDFTETYPASEAVWVLKGIYTPYGVDENGNADITHYGYTDDGWLYGYRIQNYTPYQYSGGSAQTYTVTYQDGMYRYATDTQYGDHHTGDLYTDVSMSRDKQSNVFFTPSLKHNEGDHFYYDFTGYRYAFAPTANYHTSNSDGDKIEVIANQTSLSLIWYNYYVEENSGIAGQLIISSQDFEVAYLTSSQIIQAYDTTTSTAKFTLNFKGIPMNVYIRLDPYALSQGMSVEQCYNAGFWSVMVTSISTDSSAYTGPDYGINAQNLFETVIDLFTFNYTDYNMNDTMGMICSFVIVIPFYAALIALCIESFPLLIGVGLLAAIQTIASVVINWGWPFN